MNTPWIARVVLAAILLYASALALEKVAAWFGRARRWLWLAAMAAAVALPAVAMFVPTMMPSLGLEPRPQAVEAIVSQGTTSTLVLPPASSAPTMQRADNPAKLTMLLGPTLWLALSGVLLVAALLAGVRLAVVRRNATLARINDVDVYVTKDLGPLVAGLVSPAILVPRWVARAPEAERDLILAHEREHVAGGDHWLVPLGALLLIAMPWNPVLWLMCARYRLTIETDCDARVIAAGADRRAYAVALIRVAGRASVHHVLSPAWSARQLEHRVRAMTAVLPKARGVRSALLSVGAGLLVAVACDAATPDPMTAQHVSGSAPAPSGIVLARVVNASPVQHRMFRGKLRDATTVSATLTSGPQVADVGAIRVTGYTRKAVRTRVHFDGLAGRLVVLDGRVLSTEGDTAVEVITPAVVTVVGDRKYRVVASSQESDAEVEIAGVFPANTGFPTMATARGPAPGILFLGATLIADAVDARRVAMNNVLRLPAPTRDESVDLSALQPGQIRVESESGERILVQIRGEGELNVTSRSMSSAVDGTVTALTPFVLTFRADGAFGVVFSAVDSTQMITASARGGVGTPFQALGGRYKGALSICSSRSGGGIGGARWGASPAEACKQ